MSSSVITGTVAFSNVTKTDVYQGKDTGKYNVVVTMDADEAAKLESQGVKLKDYEGKLQRKFTSKYPPEVLDLDGHRVAGEIPFGSEVRVLYTLGQTSPEWGTAAYLQKVRLVSVGEGGEEPEEF